MTIEEQADAALEKWKLWVKQWENDSSGTAIYWRRGNLKDYEFELFKTGYLRGVADKLSGMTYEDYQQMWDHAEFVGELDASLHEDLDMVGKCHASGYVQGFRSIGEDDGV